MAPMKWPPKLIHTEVLGEVKDDTNNRYTRDIGRPFRLGANAYLAFGDTFCHDGNGTFRGLVNNSYALVADPRGRPCETTYLDRYGQFGILVGEWVPFTESERKYEDDPGNRSTGSRMTCWSFGGVVEDEDGCGRGWVFFDKKITHGAQSGHHFGMGVCRATVQADKRIKMERPMGDEMIFGEKEPRFGSISHLIDDDGWVYLFGSYDPDVKAFDMRMHVARIRRDADFTKRDNYEFRINTLDGRGAWEKTYGYIDALAKFGDLNTQSQGSIFKAPGFAPEGRPFMWIGVNKFGVGHMFMGSAPSVIGPWEVHNMGPLPDAPDSGDGKKGPRYALYPNPRASNLKQGEMLCTWTDAAVLGGKVIAANFRFEGT